MLEEQSVIDQIMILEDGQIQVRRADKILRDGEEIAKAYHRHVLHPGQGLDNEDSRVADIARLVHTPAVVAAFEAAEAASNRPSTPDVAP